MFFVERIGIERTGVPWPPGHIGPPMRLKPTRTRFMKSLYSTALPGAAKHVQESNVNAVAIPWWVWLAIAVIFWSAQSAFDRKLLRGALIAGMLASFLTAAICFAKWAWN